MKLLGCLFKAPMPPTYAAQHFMAARKSRGDMHRWTNYQPSIQRPLKVKGIKCYFHDEIYSNWNHFTHFESTDEHSTGINKSCRTLS